MLLLEEDDAPSPKRPSSLPRHRFKKWTTWQTPQITGRRFRICQHFTIFLNLPSVTNLRKASDHRWPHVVDLHLARSTRWLRLRPESARRNVHRRCRGSTSRGARWASQVHDDYDGDDDDDNNVVEVSVALADTWTHWLSLSIQRNPPESLPLRRLEWTILLDLSNYFVDVSTARLYLTAESCIGS